MLTAFAVDAVRDRRRQRHSHDDSLRTACERLITAAMMIAHRAQILQTTGVFRSGIGEGLDIATRVRKPLDPIDIGEYLMPDTESLWSAQAAVRSLGDGELMLQANEVTAAAMKVLDLSSVPVPAPVDSSLGSRVEAKLRSLQRAKLDPAREEEKTRAIGRLGYECRVFSQLVRKRLGTPDPEVLLRLLPERAEVVEGDASETEPSSADDPKEPQASELPPKM